MSGSGAMREVRACAVLLGATGLGATWCSVSPDFGVGGILDRLGQVAPRVIYAVQSYSHGGRTYDVSEKLASVVSRLPTVERVVIVGADATSADASRT